MLHIVLQRKRSEPSDSEEDEEDDFKVSELLLLVNARGVYVLYNV